MMRPFEIGDFLSQNATKTFTGLDDAKYDAGMRFAGQALQSEAQARIAKINAEAQIAAGQQAGQDAMWSGVFSGIGSLGKGIAGAMKPPSVPTPTPSPGSGQAYSFPGTSFGDTSRWWG